MPSTTVSHLDWGRDLFETQIYAHLFDKVIPYKIIITKAAQTQTYREESCTTLHINIYVHIKQETDMLNTCTIASSL